MISAASTDAGEGLMLVVTSFFLQSIGWTIARHSGSKGWTRQRSYYSGGNTSTAMLMSTPGMVIQHHPLGVQYDFYLKKENIKKYYYPIVQKVNLKICSGTLCNLTCYTSRLRKLSWKALTLFLWRLLSSLQPCKYRSSLGTIKKINTSLGCWQSK